MINKELFEKAQFGDRFTTRGGQEALFLRLTENSEWQFADFYVKDWGLIRVNRENGKWLNGPDTKNDIVGKMSSLPSNLDEAAEEYAIQGHKNHTSVNYINTYIEGKRIGFKAGAEWMAGQGISAKSKVCKLAERAWVTAINEKQLQHDIYDNFADGDKVIVQIRKKQ